MFCPDGDEEESLRRLKAVALAVSSVPLASFLYSLLVWFVYSMARETKWTHCLWGLVLRWAILMSSLAASCGVVELCGGICSSNGTVEETTTLADKLRSLQCAKGLTLVIASLFGIVSVRLMRDTRKKMVSGTDIVPFYGSEALAGKLMVVTGANSGIGFETTRQLAEQGATVVMLCRNPKRATKAMDDILKLQASLHANNPVRHPTASISRDQLFFVPIDLTDFESIRKATKSIENLLQERNKKTTKQQPSYVDALICNAGLMMGTQYFTKDGFETMMQANHLGHFLLIKLMLEKEMLRTKGNGSTPATEPSRVCILTSCAYLFTASTSGFDFDDPNCSNGQRKFSLFNQYSMTKLANLLTSRELALRYNTGGPSDIETSLAVFAVHPGIVKTNVTDNMPWYVRWPSDYIFSWLAPFVQKLPFEGAYSTVYTMSTPLSQIPFWKKGSFVFNCREEAANDYVEGPRGSLDATRLWEWSEGEIAKNKNASEKKDQ